MPHQPFLTEGCVSLGHLTLASQQRAWVSLVGVFPLHQEHGFSTGVCSPSAQFQLQIPGKASWLF